MTALLGSPAVLAFTQPPIGSLADRRSLLRAGSATALGSWLPQFMQPPGAASAASRLPKAAKGATNEVVRTVNGIRHKRMGGGDLVVSEMGLGTQRWCTSPSRTLPRPARASPPGMRGACARPSPD